MQQCCIPLRFRRFLGLDPMGFLRVVDGSERQGDTHVKGYGSAAVTEILGTSGGFATGGSEFERENGHGLEKFDGREPGLDFGHAV